MVTARRARLTGLVVLLLTFTVGGLVGAATVQILRADETQAPRRGPAPPGPDFLDRLELRADQRAQIDLILERRRAQMEAFWTTHRPALRGIADSARAELRAVLTPEQQALEEQYRNERRQHQRERRDEKE
jgi:Spy/CpxP family protein refolding chaperone